jgi:hypothetical protein
VNCKQDFRILPENFYTSNQLQIESPTAAETINQFPPPLDFQYIFLFRADYTEPVSGQYNKVGRADIAVAGEVGAVACAAIAVKPVGGKDRVILQIH